MKRPAKRPAAAISSKRPACVQPPAEQVRDLSGFPEPNDWASLLPQVSVHRPLVVSMPCVGIDGCGYALESMGVSYSAVNVYDLESRYEAHLRSHLGASCELHLGQVEGDLTQHLCSRGLPCDLLVSGPPCPPWAGNVSNLFVYPEPRFPRSVCLCKAYRKCVVDQGSSSAEKKVCRCVVCALCFGSGACDLTPEVSVKLQRDRNQSLVGRTQTHCSLLW